MRRYRASDNKIQSFHQETWLRFDGGGITGTLHEKPTPNLPSVEDGISEADMKIAIEEYRQKWGQNLQDPAVFSKPKLAEYADVWGTIQSIFVLPILYLSTLCLRTLQCAAM